MPGYDLLLSRTKLVLVIGDSIAAIKLIQATFEVQRSEEVDLRQETPYLYNAVKV